MSVIVTTTIPTELVGKIKKAIADGHIDTWEVDDDGDFTHSAAQWKNRAWLRAFPQQGQVEFKIVKPEGVALDAVVYGIYHGRFIETLLMHLGSSFSMVKATPFVG